MPAARRLYPFEGQLMTMGQIRAIVPVVCAKSIRRHIDAGRVTAAAMLAYKQPGPKPRRTSHIRIGARIPHAMGGPAPTAPVPVR